MGPSGQGHGRPAPRERTGSRCGQVVTGSGEVRCYSEHKPSCRVARGYDSGRQADGTGVGRGAVQAQAQPAFCGLPQRWSRGRLALEPAVSPSLSSPSMCAGAGGPHLPTCLRLPGQALSPQRIPAAVTPPPLMSPLVFAQPSWAPLQERSRAPLPPGNQDPAATPPGLLLPLRTPEPLGTPGSALSKLQLQEALLHLIQNDDNFLNIIYEAYLFSLTQAAVKKTL